jgi:hypothetical protein
MENYLPLSLVTQDTGLFLFFFLHSRFLLFLHRDCLSSPPRAGALPSRSWFTMARAWPRSALRSHWPHPAPCQRRPGWLRAAPDGHVPALASPAVAARAPPSWPCSSTEHAPSRPLRVSLSKKKAHAFFSPDAWIRVSLI